MKFTFKCFPFVNHSFSQNERLLADYYVTNGKNFQNMILSGSFHPVFCLWFRLAKRSKPVVVVSLKQCPIIFLRKTPTKVWSNLY